jgi:PTH1 family peptidyl-tRNA hydrolase
MQIRLIVGLGNYGVDYINTRHNIGFWAIDEIAKLYKVNFHSENKFYGDIARIKYNDNEVFLLKPLTYMNLSGKSIASLVNFYKIKPQEIVVIHDELDFSCGIIKIKNGGGNGGHNGLKSIDSVIGNNYLRIRIGIDHPLDRSQVANYVLKSPLKTEKDLIEQAINKLLLNLNYLISYQIEKFTKLINTK